MELLIQARHGYESGGQGDIMKKLQRIASKYVHSLRYRGVISTIRSGVYYLFKRRRPIGSEFDNLHKVDTAGNEALWTLVDDPSTVIGGNQYQPSSEQDIETAIHFLNIDAKNYEFIDIGCGKGKPLLVASRFGFRSLIGVEFVKSLANIAVENLHRQNIVGVEVLNIDARVYRFGARPTVVFMYNPFQRQIMDVVVENMCSSEAHPLYVIYAVPSHSSAFEQTGKFVRIHSFTGEKTNESVEIWRRI
jgi:SAM-dependent methyltransferase